MLSLERISSTGEVPVRGEVVFICTGNSARSPFAAALWNHSTQHAQRARATSAGTHPAPQVSDKAVEVAQRFDVDLSAHTPRPLVEDQSRVHTIILCDRAYEELPPVESERGLRRHWAVPNPGRSMAEAAYERVFCEIAERIELFAPRTESTL